MSTFKLSKFEYKRTVTSANLHFVNMCVYSQLFSYQSSKASLDRMLTQYTAQATKPGYSAALYRAYRAVGGGAADEGSSEPPDPFALVTARVEEELKSPLQNMLGVMRRNS